MFIDIVNLLIAILTVVFGGMCFLWPDFAMRTLKLANAETGAYDGMSEMRAASGGSFLGTTLGALILQAFGSPLGWVALGMHYLGAAAGRGLSIALDGSGSRRIWTYFLFEVAFAVWLIGANWP